MSDVGSHPFFPDKSGRERLPALANLNFMDIE
jgi:hypothetical protein